MSEPTFQVTQEEAAHPLLYFAGSDTVSLQMRAWLDELERPVGDISTIEVAHEFEYRDMADGSVVPKPTGKVRVTLHFSDGETRWRMFKSNQVQSQEEGVNGND